MSPPSRSIPQNPSPQMAVVLKCIESFSVDDEKVFNEVMSADYTHEVLPKSIGLPIETKAEYLRRVGKTRHLMQDFEVSGDGVR